MHDLIQQIKFETVNCINSVWFIWNANQITSQNKASISKPRKIKQLTLPERLLLETTGDGGSSSSLEKTSGEPLLFLFCAVRFFKYSCTYTSFFCSPFGRATLWASSAPLSLSLVSTDGSSRNSDMSVGLSRTLSLAETDFFYGISDHLRRETPIGRAPQKEALWLVVRLFKNHWR